MTVDMGLFHCPQCTSKATNVKETRTGVPFVRLRYCPKCNHKFKTVEVNLDKDSEEYLNLVAHISADKLLERLLKILSSRPTQRVLLEQLRKQSGVKKRTIIAAETFT
jgi:transcriptional regulator NrdR family protein